MLIHLELVVRMVGGDRECSQVVFRRQRDSNIQSKGQRIQYYSGCAVLGVTWVFWALVRTSMTTLDPTVHEDPMVLRFVPQNFYTISGGSTNIYHHFTY